MKKLRISSSQINLKVGDFSGNVKKIVRDIRIARENEADIVTFPELAVCGYPPEDLLLKPSFIADNLKALHEIVKCTKGITAIVGFVSQDDDEGLYNAAAVINDSKVAGIYCKMLLPNYGVFDESRYFLPGDTSDLVFELNGVKFGVSICEDIWDAAGPHLSQIQNAGAELIINISASPFYAGKFGVRESMLAARAVESRVMIVYNNSVGGQDELVFDGGSMVIDCEGEMLCRAARFKEELMFCDLDIEHIVRKRLFAPSETAAHKRAEGTSEKCKTEPVKLTSETSREKRKTIDMPAVKPFGEVEEIYRALSLGVKDYVTKNGFEKVVIGLSGGIDSALTAAISVEALGAEHVIGVTMPSKFSSDETRSDAEKLAENLGIKLLTIPIHDLYESYLTSLSAVFDKCSLDVTEENIQARIRGNLLMALSNKFGWLVLSTGNKSEVSVGYCTLYGDMAGGFSVLKDVYKTNVYRLSEFINKKEEREVIPKSTIRREPTAELSPDQKDSDTLPPYDILDEILNRYIEMDMSIEEIVDLGYDNDLVSRVVRMVERNEYKRRQAPPGVRITKKAFGKDRRMPITKTCQT